MKTRVVVIGGGGHAAVCIDVLELVGLEVVGYLAPNKSSLHVPYLGTDNGIGLFAGEDVAFFCAIGDNRIRAGLMETASGDGFDFVSAIHPSSVMARSASVEPGAVVMPGAVVGVRAVVGGGAIINTASSVDHDCVVNGFAHIAPGVHLAGNVHVGEGALIGVGASITPGVKVGSWSIVGAGSVVVRDVAPGQIVVGSPATPLQTKSSKGDVVS
jgi:sugar O-acyltransferase (sialic acid O-acetyltransferase NeuD family)